MSLIMDRAGFRSADTAELVAERFGWDDLADLDIAKVVWVKQFNELSLPIFTHFVHFHLTTYIGQLLT